MNFPQKAIGNAGTFQQAVLKAVKNPDKVNLWPLEIQEFEDKNSFRINVFTWLDGEGVKFKHKSTRFDKPNVVNILEYDGKFAPVICMSSLLKHFRARRGDHRQRIFFHCYNCWNWFKKVDDRKKHFESCGENYDDVTR